MVAAVAAADTDATAIPPLRARSGLAYGSPFGSVLVWLALTDLERQVLPNRVVLPCILVAVVGAASMGDEALTSLAVSWRSLSCS